MKKTLEKKASLVATCTAAFLVCIKLIVGIMSGSIAILASATDSLFDLCISAFNLFAIRESEKPASQKYNYGKGKIEAIATLIEGSAIAMSGIVIFYHGVKSLYVGEGVAFLELGFQLMAISSVITCVLVLYLSKIAKITNSEVIKADVLHYKTDIISNLGIFVSIGIIWFTQWYFIDGVVGILISFYIFYSALELIKTSVFVLLDGSLEEGDIAQIKEIITAHPKVSSYHFLRTRKSASINFVDVHIVLGENILLKEAHDIVEEIEAKIKSINKKIKWVATIHTDPVDDSDDNVKI